MKKILFLILFAFVTFTAQAQTGTVRGRVLDSKTSEPLPFANVFINNTTLGTATDKNGNFVLRNVSRPSAFDLIISFVGYESLKQKISLTESELDIHILKLVPSEIELGAVEIKEKKDTDWERNVKKFSKAFFGEDKEAELCTIANPWVLEFPKDKNQKKFIATVNAPLEIENKALGYKLYFYLSRFESSSTDYLIEGDVRFEELLSSDDNQISKWIANRKRFYQHSKQHLFKSIVNQRMRGEGFKLYSDIQGLEAIKSRLEFFESELDRNVKLSDTSELVTPASQKGIFKISMQDRIEVHYTKEKVRVRTYRDVFGPVSWITLPKGYVLVNKEGIELNPTDVVTAGDISKGRVAQMLPLNYSPDPFADMDEEDRKSVMEELYEKIYVSTDKPYYYPGEPLWFKGFVNYKSPFLRDSLSKTAYVELIDRAQKKVVLSKIIRIDSGVFHGDFIVPDTLKASTYYLRAYTNWNRNFGSDNFFLKPLPVIDLTERVDPKSADIVSDPDDHFLITTDKIKYKPREKIELMVKLTDEDGNPESANLSVSVTDASQVIPIKPSAQITDSYPIGNIQTNISKEFSYPIEYGYAVSGRFLNDSNKPEKARLNIIQLNPRMFYIGESDEKGNFLISGLSFYDTASFSIQANPKHGGIAYGKAELIKREIPDLNFKEISYPISLIERTTTASRIISGYEAPKNTHMLKTVEVRSNRIREEYMADYKIRRPYGRPDYIVKGKNLNAGYGNLLQTIAGKIPGLVVRLSDVGDSRGPRWVVYTQRSISIHNMSEVTVTINDVIMGGTPGDILGAIDPNIVETVEVKVGINVLFGSLGGSGIVAVYLKNGIGEEEVNDKILPTIKIPGYARPRNFRFPDYSDPKMDGSAKDFRSLLYWNPDLSTENADGSASVSFFASDLSGTYHVVVEGVTKDGRPVRKEKLIEIEK